MLKSLHIENMAVIKELEFDFSDGLTVFTGETGAGKSVITDCIKFLVCNKIARDLLRNGEKKGIVSAVFGDLSDKSLESFRSLGFDITDNEVVLERSINSDGRSSCRIDGRGVSQQIMRKAGELLIAIHGQHDTLRLSDENERLNLLDTYAKSENLIESYQITFSDWKRIKSEISALIKDSSEISRIKDMLEFQTKEISSAKLRSGEEEELVIERKKLQSAERIKKHSDVATRALCSNEKGITASSLASHAAEVLNKIADVVPEFNDLAARLRSCTYELDDIAAELQSIVSNADLASDPEKRLDEIETRLALITRLRRKYGNSVEEIIEYGNTVSERLENLDSFDFKIEQLSKQESEIRSILEDKSKLISDLRIKAAYQIEKDVCESLRFLDMPKVRFSVKVSKKVEFTEKGKDDVDFLIAANAGEPLLPLSRSASGGELSRVMLAIKCTVAESDDTDTLIFDEVDTGISGKTSGKVGIKLKQASASSQVLSVTHSAQIASLAHNHILVSKHEVDGRAETKLKDLDDEGRIDEIARILGGINVSEAQRLAAIDMINEGKTY